MKNADAIIVGKIGAVYGIRGWLKVQSFTEFNLQILDYHPWYIQTSDEDWQTIEIEVSQAHGKGVIVKFKGFDTPEEARKLTGKTIAIPRSQLPSLSSNQYYWADLEGLNVVNQKGEHLGTVTHLLETGANDVLVVKGQKQHAIPYLPGKFVLNIDLEKKEILVDWDIDW